VKLESISPIG